MATPTIVRKSFNGGEIAPELHYRSDLETYHNSCKSLLNMLVTPWGAATRRPPTELLATFDTATYGVPVKYVPFRFSLTEFFHIIYTDGSGSAGTDATTADIIVYDADGVLQTLDGASTNILDTIYDPDDLLNLHFIQVNDYIYQTCGGAYPVQALNRFYDDAEAGNRWKIEEWATKGGPFQKANVDADSTVAIAVDEYDVATTYDEGDEVFGAEGGDAISSAVWSSLGNNEYELKYVSTRTFQVGTKFVVEGMTASGAVNCHYKGTATLVDGEITGEYACSNRISSTSWKGGPIVTLTPGGTLPTINTSSGLVWKAEEYGSFYLSVVGSNTGNALSDTAYWVSFDSYTGSINITSSVGIFASTDVGRLLQVQINNDYGTSGDWTADTASIPIIPAAVMTLKTEGGAWEGKLELQESKDGGVRWETRGFIESIDGSSNGSIEREFDTDTSIIRVILTGYDDPVGTYVKKSCAWTLQATGNTYELYEITAFTSASAVTVDTVTPIAGPRTDHRWAMSEFSETSGYPTTLTIHEERMVLGGTTDKPNTVWASRINDWNNFLRGDNDVSPYNFTVKSDSFDTIRWLRSSRALMIGTDNSETTMGTLDDSKIVGPANVDVKTHTYFGSANIQAIVTADLLFFVQGQAERVRSTQYDFGTDQYLSSEMSILAHHIPENGGGIKEMSFRRHPFSNIFFVLNDGTAASFTYERDNQVKGWSRIELGGSATILSASSNYSDMGDVIAGIAKRGTDYTLELFGTTAANTVCLDSQKQFVDQDYSAGVTVPWSDATGLTVIRDDVELTVTTDYTISAGTLTIPAHTDGTVTVGFKFEFDLQPTDIIELGDHGSHKRSSKLSLYLLRSGGCDVTLNGVAQAFQASAGLAAGAYLQGEYPFSVGGGSDTSIQLKLSGNHHKPFNLSAFGVFGKRSQ